MSIFQSLAGLTTQAGAAVTLESSTNCGDLAGATSKSWAHSVVDGNYLLVVAAINKGSGTPITSVTWDGTPLTPLGSSTGYGMRGVYFYGLQNPAPGTLTLAVTFAVGTYGSVAAFTFAGATQTGEVVGAFGNSSNAAVFVPLAAGEMSIGANIDTGGHDTTTAGTEIFNIDGSFGISPVFCSRDSGTDYAWTLLTTDAWAAGGIAVKP